MADAKEQFLRVSNLVKQEVEVVVATFKEKGAERFARPLAGALIAILAGHQVLYKPSQKKLARVTGTVRAAEATSKYADEYVSVRDAVRAAHSKLPGPRDKDTFLFEKVREALNAENLVTGTLAPPSSIEHAGLARQTMTLTLELKFQQLVSFLARLEAIKPAIVLTSLDLNRSQSQGIGYNRVTLEVTTVIPLRRPG